jgi:hypothetical protein
VRDEVLQRVAAFTGAATPPPHLDAALTRLEASAWPEMVDRWSRLTPTGFPVELWIRDGDPRLRWAAEIAGPELPEGDRLGSVASLMAEGGQAVPEELLARLHDLQRGRQLRFGAWLGAREHPTEPVSFKLYAEVPGDADPTALGMPDMVRDALACCPLGTTWSTFGIEPGRSRRELYVAPPVVELEQLLPALHTLRHPDSLACLERALPDGLARLRGRRLGLSVTHDGRDSLEVSIFVAVRSLFPGDPDRIVALFPAAAPMLKAGLRPTLLTILPDPAARGVGMAAGFTIAKRNDAMSAGAGADFSNRHATASRPA